MSTSSAPPTAAAPSELDPSVAVIVSNTLAEFFGGSASPQTKMTSTKILLKLLQNAIAVDNHNNNHSKIRLGNPKIQQHIVSVPGALDVLLLAGFCPLGQDQQYLLFGSQQQTFGTPAELQAQHDQQTQLVQTMCRSLQVQCTECETTMMDSSPQNNNNNNNNKKQKTDTACATTPKPSASNNTNNNILSDPERQRRVAAAKAEKAAKKAAQQLALQRWEEDKQDRQEAAARKEAALLQRTTAVVVSRGTTLLPLGVASIRAKQPPSLPLAQQQPMAARSGEESQKQMLAVLAKERQARKNATTSTAAAFQPTATVASKSATNVNDGTVDNDAERKEAEDRKLPAKASVATKPQPVVHNNETTPTSTEWEQFTQKTPRCAAAEGIRETSVYHKSAKAADDATLSVPTTCLKHLLKELDGLKDALPDHPIASIWVRFDEETPQYVRACLAAPLPGPTPYTGGLFLLDMFVPPEYPHVPPQVSIITTGRGTVRFGPNLYADGKVCLSLLGTWPGPKWDPRQSTLYQVLISIQGLLLGIEHPYYLEPGHGGWEGDIKEGDFSSTGHTLAGAAVKEEVGVPQEVVLYEDNLRVGTVKYCMLEPLSMVMTASVASSSGKKANMWDPFASIIQAHFATNHLEIVAEVRKWMSDHTLGRNRSTDPMEDEPQAFIIDQLQKLLPKLEKQFSKVATMGALVDNSQSLEKNSSAEVNTLQGKAAASMDTTDEEEDSKPAAKPSPREPQSSNDDKNNIDVVEQKRQAMQEAATKGDYVVAGQLQEEVKRLDDLKRSMEEAAKQGDFIRAGRLQAQFMALTMEDKKAPSKAAGGSAPVAEDSDYEEGEEMPDENQLNNGFNGAGFNEEEDSDDSEDENYYMGRKHAWGTGSKLAAAPAPAIPISNPVVPAVAKRSIPVDQLCRLRIRLPTNESAVEDFEKTDSLSTVYRRVEDLVAATETSSASQGVASAAVAPRIVGSGAFAQPLSSAGFTLLLTRPKREFSLEMHGTMTLDELNLAPSATLTMMKCSDRGVMHRGELESRLREAQGDAIDVEGLTYEGLVELTERLGAAAPAEGSSFVALSREQLEANSELLSPQEYLASLDEATDMAKEANESERRCPICLGEYDTTDTSNSLRKLTHCSHMFHTGCLETWLGTKSSCPLCKKSVCPES